MKSLVFSSCLLLLALFQSAGAQELDPQQSFEVDRIDPPLSLDREQLMASSKLQDLNKHFRSSWVRECLSLEISGLQGGRPRTVRGVSTSLNEAQKTFLYTADVGSEILVKLSYIPENTLSQNEAKVFDFAFLVNPEYSARYPDGYQALKSYLRKEVIDHIPAGTIEGYALAAIKFTVNEVGKIVDTHVFWSSENEAVDQMMLSAIKNMPPWIPAQYANGMKVPQEFAFSVGNRESCVVNLLNIGG